jgi:lysozyme
MEQEMSLSAAGLDFIAAHEGFRAAEYRDAAGLETIGYGHRLLAGETFPRGVTEADARRLLAADVALAEAAVRAHVAVPLTQAQFDALVSFVFNIGAGAFGGSTLLKKLNDGQSEAAADEFLRWDKVTASGMLMVDPGLAERRRAERTLFLEAA